MKKLLKNPLGLICLLFSTGIVAGIQAVEAQEQEIVGIQVTPPIIEVRADPGEVVEETIHVTNRGEGDQTLFLKTSDIKGTTQAGQPIFAEEGELTGFEMSSWIKLPQDEIELKSGGTEHVPIKIHIPEDASPGGHFAGVFFTREPIAPKESGAGVGFGVGSVFTFRVSGETQEEARIRSFYTKKVVYQKPKITFLTQIENEGNVLIRPRGLIEIWDTFGNEVAKVEVNEKRGAVFPGGTRLLEEVWNSSKISMGRYRAIVSLVYGEEGRKTISQSTSFWIIPLRIIGIGAVIILVFILGIGLGVRLYIKKKMQELQALNQKVGGYHHKKTREIEPTLLEEEGRRGFFAKLIKTTLTMFAISIAIFLLLLLFA